MMSEKEQNARKFLEGESSIGHVTLRDLVEGCYPLPLSIAFRKLRQLQDAPPSNQLRQLADVMEVLIKYLTAIASRYYLRDDGHNPRINQLLADFNTPTLGRWVELLRECLKTFRRPGTSGHLTESLNKFYFDKLDGGQSHPVYAHAAEVRRALFENDKEFLLTPTNGQLFDLFVKVRNVKLGHGASVTEPEYKDLVDCLLPILAHLLKEAEVVKEFPLYYVKEVKVENRLFVHSIQLCMGRDFELDKFKTVAEALNSREVYLCSLDRSNAETLKIDQAVSLSPYLIVEQCPTCKQQQVFFFNNHRGQRIDYLSYGCGHEFVPSWYVADFENIKDFLAGKVSLEELFRGKSLGLDLASRSVGASAEDKREAAKKLARAKDYLHDSEIALARKEAREALDLHSDLAEAHYFLGTCAIFDYDDQAVIVAHFRAAVSLDPENAVFLLTLAKILRVLQRFDDATEELQKVIKVDPTNPEARELLDGLTAPKRAET